jgi:hypothetical protein
MPSAMIDHANDMIDITVKSIVMQNRRFAFEIAQREMRLDRGGNSPKHSLDSKLLSGTVHADPSKVERSARIRDH